MKKDIQLIITPEQAEKTELLKKCVAEKLSVSVKDITFIQIVRKSIDARSRQPKVNIALEVYLNEEKPKVLIEKPNYPNVTNSQPVIVIGAGPAGLFASLRLLRLGLKPILIDRGKSASERKTDIAKLNQNKNFNEESNYCYGEGGAGTFSDGKLYTRSKKKGNVREVLETFYLHGAAENILYESHPHIGSDKLPKIVESMRNTILQHGGEVHYSTNIVKLLIEDKCIKGCVDTEGNVFSAKAVILATGHSAHAVYEMLATEGIKLENKGFAMGVRVEHPQSLIDAIQYHTEEKNPYLPAATYALVEQVDGRGVYSFCMCPGGHMVPASSNKDSIVVNGMSASKRNSPYANSGIVVEIRCEDVPEEFQQYGDLANLRYQQYVENLALRNNGGMGLVAPAQRLDDFVAGRLSVDLPKCSYLPGVVSSPLHFWLPELIGKRLQRAFKMFDKKMRGYLSHDAIIVGVESRSSSPVRIPRDNKTMQHIEIEGLFPAGEGSGYSGGITSSAIDGMNSANKIAEWLNQ